MRAVRRYQHVSLQKTQSMELTYLEFDEEKTSVQYEGGVLLVLERGMPD